MKKGFTLIELLVVISLIGVLAVSVLSALNPIEQLNKGRDAGRRADASQLINAIDRYYASNEKFPWNNAIFTADGGGTNGVVSIDGEFKVDAAVAGVGVCGGTNAILDGSGATGCTSDGVLISGLELKSQFSKRKAFRTGRVAQDYFYVIKEEADPSVAVCFIPSSKATRTDLTRMKIVTLADSPSIAPCTAVPGEADWSDLANSCLVCIPEE